MHITVFWFLQSKTGLSQQCPFDSVHAKITFLTQEYVYKVVSLRCHQVAIMFWFLDVPVCFIFNVFLTGFSFLFAVMNNQKSGLYGFIANK